MSKIQDFSTLFDYSPETGIFAHKKAKNKKRSGEIAGSKDRDGYIKLYAFGKYHMAHRVAWYITTGKWPDLVDHRDGNPANNRYKNLRLATFSQNSMNAKISIANKSGVKGVHWDGAKGRWAAVIKIDGKRVFRRYYRDLEQAESEVVAARERLQGQYARNH